MALTRQEAERFKYADASPEPRKDDDQSLESRLLKKAQEYYDLTKAGRAHRYPLWLQVGNYAKGRQYFLFHKHFHTTVDIDPKLAEQCMLTPSGLLQQAVDIIGSQYGASNGKIVPMPADENDPKMKAVMRGLREYADYLVWEFYQKEPSVRQTECKLIPQRGVYNLIEWDQSKGQKVELPQYEAVEKKVCGDCGEDVGNEQVRQDGQGDDGALSLARDDQSVMAPRQGGADRMGIAGNNTDGLLSAADVAGKTEAGSGFGDRTDGRAVCPACGSPNLQTITAGVTNKGNITRTVGAPVKRTFDPFQVEIYDRNRTIEESPYLICDDVLFKSELKRLCPHLRDIKGLASFGSYLSGYIGLHYLQQLQSVIGNSGNLNQVGEEYYDTANRWSVGWEGSYLNPLLCWRRRVWFDVDVYADWTMGTDKPVQLPGRKEWIPPQTKVKDVFPSGLCFWIVNGDTVIWTENQDKDDVWSFCGYRMPSEGLHGSGVTSLVSLVKGYDAANSYALQALLMAALGILVVDERIPTPRNVPGSMLRIPQAARLQGESITSLAGRLDMGGGSAIAAAEPVKQGFLGRVNAMTMAANPTGDAQTRPQGVGAGTATAVRYEAGTVSVLTNPPLELYGAHKAKVVGQAIKQAKQRSIRPPQFGKFGDTVMKTFDLMSVPGDVQFGQAEGSYRMKTIETERDDLLGIAGILPAIAGNEPLMNKALEVFGLADEVGDVTDWEIIAEKRLDAMKALAPQFEPLMEQAEQQSAMMTEQAQAAASSGTPEGVMAAQAIQAQVEQAKVAVPLQLIESAQAAPLPMEASGHHAFVRFWEETRKSDEWDGFPKVLQDAIQSLWAISQKGVGQAGAIQTEQQVIASAPARQAQQEDSAKQAEQQAALEPQNGDDSEQQEASADNVHARQMQAGSVSHAQTRELEAEKHKRTKELENLKTKNALKVEAERAKSKPKGAVKK